MTMHRESHADVGARWQRTPDEKLMEAIRQITQAANSVHTTYHGDPLGTTSWRECSYKDCRHAQEATALVQEVLTGSGK